MRRERREREDRGWQDVEFVIAREKKRAWAPLVMAFASFHWRVDVSLARPTRVFAFRSISFVRSGDSTRNFFPLHRVILGNAFTEGRRSDIPPPRRFL